MGNDIIESNSLSIAAVDLPIKSNKIIYEIYRGTLLVIGMVANRGIFSEIT